MSKNNNERNRKEFVGIVLFAVALMYLISSMIHTTFISSEESIIDNALFQLFMAHLFVCALFVTPLPNTNKQTGK